MRGWWRLALLFAAVLTLAPAARGQDATLPAAQRAAIVEAVDDACPECRRTGFVVCGAAAVAGPAGFAGAGLQGRPGRAYLVPQPLHACVADQARPWGCCVAPGCRNECCEKNLGSPSVTLNWVDAAAQEEILFEFRHGERESRLVRTTPAGRTVYSCLTDRRYVLR